MENAVIRSTDKHPTEIGSHCLIGPHAHLVGCTLEDCVFVATGASVFHGARLGYGSEVRINGVVHLRTKLPAHATVPIGWVAVGNPPQILPPDQHEAIWALQKPLNFRSTSMAWGERLKAKPICQKSPNSARRCCADTWKIPLYEHFAVRVVPEADNSPESFVASRLPGHQEIATQSWSRSILWTLTASQLLRLQQLVDPSKFPSV